jgi:hypothetical protein
MVVLSTGLDSSPIPAAVVGDVVWLKGNAHEEIDISDRTKLTGMLVVSGFRHNVETFSVHEGRDARPEPCPAT